MERIKELIQYMNEYGHQLEAHVEEKLRTHVVKFDIYDIFPYCVLSTLLWMVFMYWDKSGFNRASTIHSLYVTAVSTFNLYVGMDDHFEDHLFVVMSGYFVGDYLVNCLNPKDRYVFFFHHAITTFAVYCMITMPTWNAFQYASRCILLEGSTPFLNWWKQSGSIL